MGWAFRALSAQTLPWLFEVQRCVEGRQWLLLQDWLLCCGRGGKSQAASQKHKLPVNQCHQQLQKCPGRGSSELLSQEASCRAGSRAVLPAGWNRVLCVCVLQGHHPAVQGDPAAEAGAQAREGQMPEQRGWTLSPAG